MAKIYDETNQTAVDPDEYEFHETDTPGVFRNAAGDEYDARCPEEQKDGEK